MEIIGETLELSVVARRWPISTDLRARSDLDVINWPSLMHQNNKATEIFMTVSSQLACFGTLISSHILCVLICMFQTQRNSSVFKYGCWRRIDCRSEQEFPPDAKGTWKLSTFLCTPSTHCQGKSEGTKLGKVER